MVRTGQAAPSSRGDALLPLPELADAGPDVPALGLVGRAVIFFSRLLSRLLFDFTRKYAAADGPSAATIAQWQEQVAGDSNLLLYNLRGLHKQQNVKPLPMLHAGATPKKPSNSRSAKTAFDLNCHFDACKS